MASNQDEIRDEVKQYFEAIGNAEPWGWDTCVKDYTDAVMTLIAQQQSKAVREVLERLQGNVQDPNNIEFFDPDTGEFYNLEEFITKELERL